MVVLRRYKVGSIAFLGVFIVQCNGTFHGGIIFFSFFFFSFHDAFFNSLISQRNFYFDKFSMGKFFKIT